MPEGFFCVRPAEGVRWLRADGELEYVRCGASNRCDYCAMLAACENAVVLRLDAFDGAFPQVGLTTTTHRSDFPWELLRGAERSLWRSLRREFGRTQVQYCGCLEWTTGSSWRSQGYRFPHLHHLVKGIPREMVTTELEGWISELWRGYTGGAWRVDFKPLYTPMGAIAYLVLHHHKREQGPPPGTKHVKRLRPSKGYTERPLRELREEARLLLQNERLYAELVETMSVPDGAPSFLVEELIAERVDQAQAERKMRAPRLCHVRERRRVDRVTGEVLLEFSHVLRVLSKGAG